jgi:hypothetical protein
MVAYSAPNSNVPNLGTIQSIPQKLSIEEQIFMYGRIFTSALQINGNSTLLLNPSSDTYVTNITLFCACIATSAPEINILTITMDSETIASINFNNFIYAGNAGISIPFNIPIRIPVNQVLKFVCSPSPFVDSFVMTNISGYTLPTGYRFT